MVIAVIPKPAGTFHVHSTKKTSTNSPGRGCWRRWAVRACACAAHAEPSKKEVQKKKGDLRNDASDAQLLVPYTCGWGGTPMGRWPTIRRSLGPPAGASLYLEHFCPFAGICGGSLAYLVSRAVRIHAPDIVKRAGYW